MKIHELRFRRTESSRNSEWKKSKCDFVAGRAKDFTGAVKDFAVLTNSRVLGEANHANVDYDHCPFCPG